MPQKSERELLSKYSSITDSARQRTILYLLKSRMAAGFENQELGTEDLTSKIQTARSLSPDQDPMGVLWQDAAYNFEELVKADPQSAFNLALHLTLLPSHPDSNLESVYQWIRSDGPLNLADPNLHPFLLDYLQTPQNSDRFLRTLMDYISYDYRSVPNASAAFADPACFLGVASLYLGISLKTLDHDDCAYFYGECLGKLALSSTSRVIRYYHQFPATIWIAHELEPYLAPLYRLRF